MPTYLIVYAERRGDDTVLEDPALRLELTADWATFHDEAGLCFAAPRDRVSSILRVDDNQNPASQEPAPQKE
ncbi:hypothetical protein ABT119_05945 [Streptomyces sp. NPDC001910]|jgi:hypothetical protein|uniref:hypothetical protein n=1 Tax=Streptomyces sp. NPDC001910 TaxID=3154403 RepID=UPI00332DC580